MITRALELLPDPPEKSQDQLMPLPIAHLSSVLSFEKIVSSAILKPQYCTTFNTDLIYFSYGGIFHRYENRPTSDQNKMPVALLFKPTLISKVERAFPYDTGAARKEIYSSWSNELIQFERYQILCHEDYQLLSKYIYHIYGSNEKYLSSELLLELPSETMKDLEQEAQDFITPLKTLIDFLKTDLTSYGVDHRQHSIECQTSKIISLRDFFQEIYWIGLPDKKFPLFLKLCQLCNQDKKAKWVPDYFPYRTRIGQNPDSIIELLNEKAYEIVKRYSKFGEVQ